MSIRLPFALERLRCWLSVWRGWVHGPFVSCGSCTSEAIATVRRMPMKVSVYRFNPEHDKKPYMQDYEVELEPTDRMVLDVILRIRLQDDSLTVRKSCR